MISILVDEGYAFDFLSIIHVKMHSCEDDKKRIALSKQFDMTINHLSLQLNSSNDKKKMREMMSSDEYLELYDRNKEVFDLVDRAKEDEVSASNVDEANYFRYLAKVKFQAKFFGDETLQEIKIGYDND